MGQKPFLDIHAIMKQLPHRYPFLLVDRVLECVPGETLTALKNVTINEPFFPGHFPQRPVMPGVLILEAMAQATGLLAFASIGSAPDKNELYYFVGIDKARFRLPVEPGDQLIFKVRVLGSKRGMWKFAGTAEVDGQVAAEAELMCAARKHEE
ncbi:MAG TPA: 3-hydroxyacyl-ACP dehydratase FabZ [Gammaproteobacteria bacterium]